MLGIEQTKARNTISVHKHSGIISLWDPADGNPPERRLLSLFLQNTEKDPVS